MSIILNSGFQAVELLANISGVITGGLVSLFDPLKRIFCYVFPAAGAYLRNESPVYPNDPTQGAYMPMGAKKHLFKEIDLLAEKAKLKKRIDIYAKPGGYFHSYGGSLSLTSPSLFVPYEHIFRRDRPPFGAEETQVKDDQWIFSDKEVRFLVCREMLRMKHNHELFKLIGKVALISLTAFFFTMPVPFLVSLTFAVSALGLHILFSGTLEKKIDTAAARIFGKEGLQIGISALEKQRRQNQEKRNHVFLGKLTFTKHGNDLSRIEDGLLTDRIAHMQKALSAQYDATARFV